jgi:copper resistance protein D
MVAPGLVPAISGGAHEHIPAGHDYCPAGTCQGHCVNMPAAPDALSIVARVVSFVLLLQAAGIVVFVVIFGRFVANGRSLLEIQRLGYRLAMAALVFVTAHYLLEAGRMAGEMSGVVDPSMQMMALQSPIGATFAVRVLGLALVAVGLRRSMTRARPPTLALVGAVLTISAFALTGHTSDNPHRVAAATLLIIHLLVVAFWIGALCPLYMATTREPRAVAAKLIDAFSTVASWVVPGILLAGIALTALLVPALAVFSQPYGQLLLTKVALFAVLIAMAAFNKWIFGPACANDDAQASRAFRRTVALEYGVICIVLAVTAAMTAFYSPEAA